MMTGDYFQEVNKALKDFHDWNSSNNNTRPPNNATYYSHPNLKPLYMLIKVEVDSDIVYDQEQAEKYADNHCNKLEYALCDWYYPDEPQFPYIAK